METLKNNQLLSVGLLNMFVVDDVGLWCQKGCPSITARGFALANTTHTVCRKSRDLPRLFLRWATSHLGGISTD